MNQPFTLDELTTQSRATSPEALAHDEAFWARMAAGYDRDPGFIPLNYGFYHPSLRAVLDVEIETMRELNRRGSHFKAFASTPLLEGCRSDLAALVGASPEEIAVLRSSSEGLNTVIRGLDLAPGDEVVTSDHDYTAADHVLQQRVAADGIRVTRVAVQPDLDDEELVRRFEAAMTPRTKLLVVTHLVHFSGQILPAAALCALGRRRGIPVLVDAAHSFAQLPSATAALDCDYLVASLHKWLGAPLGSGLLYVRRPRIAGIRPLFGDTTAPDNIRKLERLGNRSDAVYAGIREALRWHQALGTAAKQARLAHLQTLWTEPLRRIPGYRVGTPSRPGTFGAIGLFTLQGVEAATLAQTLMDRYRIFTVVQTPPSGPGVRVVPGMATSSQEIQALVAALEALAGERS